jgi:GNAT superfamily N-acetyltransferase
MLSLFEKTTIEVGKYKVTRASGKDALLLAALTRQDWTERVAISNRRGEVDNASSVSEELKRGGGFLLSRNGMPIGGAFYAPVKDTIWELRRLGVIRSFSGRGLTSLLLEALETSARKRSIQMIRLPIMVESLTTRQYFEQLGYRLIPGATMITAFPNANAPLMMQKFLL